MGAPNWNDTTRTRDIVGSLYIPQCLEWLMEVFSLVTQFVTAATTVSVVRVPANVDAAGGGGGGVQLSQTHTPLFPGIR